MSSPAVVAPEHWESDAVLLDGGTVRARPIRPDDGPALVAFHERLSQDTVYSRFFSAKPRLSAAEVEDSPASTTTPGWSSSPSWATGSSASPATTGRRASERPRWRLWWPTNTRGRGIGNPVAGASGLGGAGAGDQPFRGRDAAPQSADARGLPGSGVRRDDALRRGRRARRAGIETRSPPTPTPTAHPSA
jgi:hypothetical protein